MSLDLSKTFQRGFYEVVREGTDSSRQGRTQQTENMYVSPVLSELSSDICRFQQTNQTSLDVNELVFLYMVAKLLPACGKVLHYNKEITKSATKRII